MFIGKLSSRLIWFFAVTFLIAQGIALIFLLNEGLPATYLLVFLLPVAFLFIVGTVIFAWRQHQMFAKPFDSIHDVARKVEAGNYKERVKLTSVDSDITDIIYTFNALVTSFENLEQARKEFVSNASHELRSPLTSMQGFIQGMIEGVIPQEETKKYLNIVFNETKRLNTIITGMLELSRMESGKYPINKSKFDINEILRRVMVRFEPHILRKEMSIEADFISDVCLVEADKEKIEQVVVNLVDNAIKYSPAYTKLHISTHLHGGKVYVSVKDQGIGIDKKDQLLIWDRFFTADRARTPGKSKGTGLGLSIVKKIIDGHNEVIWVESSKGEGTTFIFTLTLAGEKESEEEKQN